MTEQELPDVSKGLSAIAEAAEAGAPAGWERLEVVADDSWVSSSSTAGRAHVGSQVLNVRLQADVHDRFEELRAAFRQQGRPLWVTATVTVTADDVSVEFGYDADAG